MRERAALVHAWRRRRAAGAHCHKRSRARSLSLLQNYFCNPALCLLYSQAGRLSVTGTGTVSVTPDVGKVRRGWAGCCFLARGAVPCERWVCLRRGCRVCSADRLEPSWHPLSCFPPPQVYLSVSVLKPTARAACEQAAVVTGKVRSGAAWVGADHAMGRRRGCSSGARLLPTASCEPRAGLLFSIPPPQPLALCLPSPYPPPPPPPPPPPLQVRSAVQGTGVGEKDITTENFSVQPQYTYPPEGQP